MIIIAGVVILLLIVFLYSVHLTPLKKNKCAFVIPLHPKHFDYVRQYKTLKDVDIYLVFSHERDRYQFSQQQQRSYFSLVIPPLMEHTCLQTKSFATMKKFYALGQLYNKYDYIACIDAEVIFLQTDGFYDMMKSVATSKKIYGGDSTSEYNRKIIFESLTRLTPVKDHEQLAKLSNNFTMYTWWSNVPVYDCANVGHFLEWIDLTNVNWYVFDNLLYNYFCLLFYGYELVVVPNLQDSLENAESETIEFVNDGTIYWVNANAYFENQQYYKDFFIVFHLDRRGTK